MGLAPLMLFATTLLIVRNQRILAAWNARQAENARRAAAGLPPKTRKRRRKTLASLAATAAAITLRHPSAQPRRHAPASRQPSHGDTRAAPTSRTATREARPEPATSPQRAGPTGNVRPKRENSPH